MIEFLTHKKKVTQILCNPFRAENEARTRDPNLGKVMLYQLSYFRNLTFFASEEKETRTPTTQLSLPPQSSASTNSATSPSASKASYTVECAQNRTRTYTSSLTLAPETSASTIPPPGQILVKARNFLDVLQYFKE